MQGEAWLWSLPLSATGAARRRLQEGAALTLRSWKVQGEHGAEQGWALEQEKWFFPGIHRQMGTKLSSRVTC